MGEPGQRRRPALRADREKPERDDRTTETGSVGFYDKSEARRSEDTVRKENVPVDRQLTSMLDALSLDDENPPDSLENIQNFLDLASPSIIKDNILHLFSMCLENRDVAVKAAKQVFGYFHCYKIGDETLRSVVLTLMQKELEGNDFLKGNRTRFLNAVFLLSELYFHIRIENQPISIIGGELIKYFRWLITGDEQELEVLAVCLIINGSDLKKDKPVSYRKLMTEIRVTLVTRKLSSISKSWLLLIIDMDYVNYETLPEDLLICHMTFVGESAFQKFKRTRIERTPPIQYVPPSSLPVTHSNLPSNNVPLSPLPRPSNLQRVPSDASRSGDKWKSPEGQSSVDRWSTEPKTSKHRPPSPGEWHSPERSASPERRRSTDNWQSNESRNTNTRGRWSLSDTSNRGQRTEGRFQPSQSLGTTSQKNVPGKWSSNPPSSAHGQKHERKIPVWQNEHDDRFDRDYGN